MSKKSTASASPEPPRGRKISAKAGYGRPPKSGQFRKGRSGNPKGRPKGSRNKVPPTERRIYALFKQELARPLTTSEGDAQVTMETLQALIRRIIHDALRGKPHAQKLVLSVANEIEKREVEEHRAYAIIALEYKRRWTKELRDCERRGIKVEPPIPHPDHVHVDLQTGDVTYSGPVNEEQKEAYDWFEYQKQSWQEAAQRFRQRIRRARNPDRIAQWERELARAEEMLDLMCVTMPRDRWEAEYRRAYLRFVRTGDEKHLEAAREALKKRGLQRSDRR